MKDIKVKFAAFVIAIAAGLQLYAWYSNHNGVVFAFTSLCIGSVVGAVLGFEWGIKRAR